jgi:nitroreductase
VKKLINFVDFEKKVNYVSSKVYFRDDFSMFKKFYLLTLVTLFATNVYANNNISLPNPIRESDLMNTIDLRVSSRLYSNKEISLQTLSDLLWVAYGVNKNGTRTIATARNEQNLKLYVVYKGTVWFYDAFTNSLVKITNENVMGDLAKQEFVADAPVNLIYVGSDKEYSAFHAGSATQNVYLYATKNGLNTIVRGLIDKEALKRKLRLTSDEFVIINQVVGYPKSRFFKGLF